MLVNLRTDGYIKALKENGISVNEDLIVKIEDIDNCSNKIKSLIKNQEFDAFFAVNELFAVTAIKLANKFKVKKSQMIFL